ncbi:MAG: 6-phosphogluconolactonase [Idiomarina sp.]|nr:6-phosphogluconolactonase [Idiomarina sp.]
MSAEVIHFDDEERLVAQFSQQIEQQLEAAIRARGQAYLVVSGGRTPLKLFDRLSQSTLAWDKVTVLLADERWVSADHADSNEAMVRQHLLVANARQASFISMLGDMQNISDDVDSFNAKAANLPTFDVVILGMGDDAHTASLFPCSTQLTDGLQSSLPALAVTPNTAPHQRISLTRARLLNSRQLYLQLKGDAKRQVLQHVLEQGPRDSLPISYFIHQSDVPMQVLLADA